MEFDYYKDNVYMVHLQMVYSGIVKWKLDFADLAMERDIRCFATLKIRTLYNNTFVEIVEAALNNSINPATS